LILLGVKRAPWALIVCIAFAAILRFLLYPAARGVIDIDFFTPTRLDTIAVGCLLAFAFRTQWIQKLRGERVAAVAGLLFLVSVFVLSRSGKYTLGPEHPVEGALIAVIIACFVQDATGITRRLLNSRIMIWIGTLSYSLYLAQTIVTTDLVPLPIRIPAMFAYACFSYYLIEAPFLRLKDRTRSGASKEQVVQV
jgi:peptidoglycan/LPS O-acetylase OafA/YrhL